MMMKDSVFEIRFFVASYTSAVELFDKTNMYFK